MTNLEMAALIERKSKALKHCNKLLEKNRQRELCSRAVEQHRRCVAG